MNCFGETPQALRSFSVLFGVATFVGCYQLGCQVYTFDAVPADRAPNNARGFGLFCAAVCACSAFQVHASVEARMYSLGTFLFVLGQCLTLFVAAQPSSRRGWTALAIVSAASLYTHHFLALNVAFSGIWLCCRMFVARHEREPHASAYWRNGLAAAAFILVACIPALVLWWVQFSTIRKGFWIPDLTIRAIPQTVGEFLLGAIPGLRPTPWAVTLPITMITGAVLFRVAITCRAGMGLMLCQGLGPMAAIWFVSIGSSIWESRYFRFSFVAILICLAFGLWGRTERHRRIRIGIFLSALLCGTVMFWIRRDIPNRQAVRGAMTWIARNATSKADTTIVVTEPMNFVIAKYYAPQFGFRRDRIFVCTGRQSYPGFAPHLLTEKDWWKGVESDGNVWLLFDSRIRADGITQRSPEFRSDLHLPHWSVWVGLVQRKGLPEFIDDRRPQGNGRITSH